MTEHLHLMPRYLGILSLTAQHWIHEKAEQLRSGSFNGLFFFALTDDAQKLADNLIIRFCFASGLEDFVLNSSVYIQNKISVHTQQTLKEQEILIRILYGVLQTREPIPHSVCYLWTVWQFDHSLRSV